MFRIAVNVNSSLTSPDLLFQTITALPNSLTPHCTALKTGSPPWPTNRSTAQDFRPGRHRNGK